MPVTFQASHDAFAIYLTPASRPAAASRAAITSWSWAATACAWTCTGTRSAAGAAIDQWTCNGQSNQQFQFVPGSGGYGELQAQNSGQVRGGGDSSTAAGTPDIVQQARNGSAAACGSRCSSPTAPRSSRTAAAACAWTSTAPAATRPATGPVAVQERPRHQPGLLPADRSRPHRPWTPPTCERNHRVSTQTAVRRLRVPTALLTGLVLAAGGIVGTAAAPARGRHLDHDQRRLRRPDLRRRRRDQRRRRQQPAADRLSRAPAQPGPGLPVQARLRRRPADPQGRDRRGHQLHRRRRAQPRAHPRPT